MMDGIDEETPLIEIQQNTTRRRRSRIKNAAQQFVGDIVGKNNQNTMLLDRVFEVTIRDDTGDTHDHKIIGLQGETRVFLFDCGRKSNITDQELDNRKEQCRNFLLKLYVAPIIRILKIASTFFSVLDNATFACILLLFFGSKVLNPESESTIAYILDGKNAINTAIVVTMCSDLLHNIMHASTRLWNLNRVDLPLVLVLYLAYYVMLVVSLSDWVYFYTLSFRFVAFYVTTSCEYWVDMLVVKSLMKLQQETDFTLPLGEGCGCVSRLVSRLGFPYSRVNLDDREALTCYKGTFCSWNWWQSSSRFLKEFREDGNVQNTPTKCGHFCFYIGGLIAFVTVFLLSCVVLFLASIPYGLVHLFSCCCRFCDLGIHEEIWMF